MEFYHGKNHHMWSYCIPLGQYISKDGRKYDLGVFIKNKERVSFAIVYGKKGDEYISGEIWNLDHEFGGWSRGGYRTETIKRYKDYLKGKQVSRTRNRREIDEK
tara:strand:+ start:358 stop:669 length:312 start_codon:yes stop_codon:yes gene_type:complete